MTAAKKQKNSKKNDNEFKKQIDNGFLSSSHIKYWLHKNLDEINKKRQNIYNNSIKNITKILQSKNNKFIPPSFNEYKSVLTFHEEFIIKTCRQFGFPNYVPATAVSYFKRFYLLHSLIDIDGKALACCAIFLASKTEQCLFDIKNLSKLVKIDSKIIVKSEIILMNGIKFHLKVWNPFRAFRCLLRDFQTIFQKMYKKKLNEFVLKQINIQTSYFIVDTYLTDASLLYTPSQIGLACMLLTLVNIDLNSIIQTNNINSDNNELTQSIKNDVKLCKNASTKYFDERFKSNKNSYNKLKNILQDIQKNCVTITNKIQRNDFKNIQTKTRNFIYALQTAKKKINNNAKKSGIKRKAEQKMNIDQPNSKRKK